MEIYINPDESTDKTKFLASRSAVSDPVLEVLETRMHLKSSEEPCKRFVRLTRNVFSGKGMSRPSVRPSVIAVPFYSTDA